MIEASVDTSKNPASQAMRMIVLDMVDPARCEALRKKIDDVRAMGADPWDIAVKLG